LDLLIRRRASDFNFKTKKIVMEKNVRKPKYSYVKPKSKSITMLTVLVVLTAMLVLPILSFA